MNNRTIAALGFAGMTALGAASPALAQPSTIIIAPTAPPAAQVETIPPPPAPRIMSWQPGRWAWADGNWRWIGGHYAEAPRPSAVWEPGHWEHYASGGYTWIDGHWRS